MEQLILHLLGDYILQSDWMANTKTTKSIAALLHCLTYSLPFLLLSPSWTALAVIFGTHFFIDRYRLAKYVIWIKNLMAPRSELHRQVGEEGAWSPVYRLSWYNCTKTGYPDETPAWLAVWLMIIADNTMHLAINFLALKYL